ncbi:MAG TPA: carboxylesterase family protein [Opitutaceae bacterium]|nr:carboxylesterase family protein [Opitutaceae bacterium]
MRSNAEPLPPLKTDRATSAASLGAPHSSDIPYALGNLDLMKDHEWTAADRETSRVMQGYFVNFIKTGNPNGEGLPEWPWLQASLPHVMQIDGSSHAIPEPNLKRYILLDSLFARAEDAN